MNHLIPPMIRPLARWAGSWAESSQRTACRNAMVASTALADRRRERVEVEEYLAHALAGRTAPTRTHRAVTAPPSLPAVRLG